MLSRLPGEILVFQHDDRAQHGNFAQGIRKQSNRTCTHAATSCQHVNADVPLPKVHKLCCCLRSYIWSLKRSNVPAPCERHPWNKKEKSSCPDDQHEPALCTCVRE